MRSGEARIRSPDVTAETTELIAFLGLTGIEHAEAASLSYGGQRLLDMGLALATRPRILLLDEPLAGLAVAERQRIAALVKTMSAEIPVLFVEHDIDRVFQIADHVTVMNEGHILVDGTVEVARNDAKVREVYIGSGAATVAATPRASAAGSRSGCSRSMASTRSTARATSSMRVSFDVREHEIVALLGRNGAGKSTLLKSLIGIARPEAGSIKLLGEDTVQPVLGRDRAAWHRLCAARARTVHRHDGGRQSGARPPQAHHRRRHPLGR